MCLCGFKVQKTHYFPHTVHYCCSSMLRLSETCWFLQSSSFWEARCTLIDQLSSALCLAEYLKHVTEMLCPLLCCDAVSWRDETKTIKPIINEAFVASSGDIITAYTVFLRIAPRRVNITMSAFVIGEICWWYCGFWASFPTMMRPHTGWGRENHIMVPGQLSLSECEQN